MRLYVIRHAQSADNQFVIDNADKGVKSFGLDQPYFGRQADPELSGIGEKQAQALGRYVAQKRGMSVDGGDQSSAYTDDMRFTHVYASLMVRSMITAGAVADALDLAPAIWEGIHETGGIWEPDPESGKPVGCAGKNRVYFEDRFPQFTLPDDLGDEGWWNRPLETTPQIKDRAQRFCDDLMEKHGGTDDRVAIVSHGLFYSFMMKALLKVQSGAGVVFGMSNTGITRVDFGERLTSVAYLNRTDHLPAELIT